jgi:hypothetical protein
LEPTRVSMPTENIGECITFNLEDRCWREQRLCPGCIVSQYQTLSFAELFKEKKLLIILHEINT